MLEKIGQNARAAARSYARASTSQKDALLRALADHLWEQRKIILKANSLDVSLAEKAGLSPALIDRLTLNETRLEGITNDLRSLADLPDPVGEVFDQAVLPNGLKIHKQRVPIGVVAVIYESRPNVTVEAASLAIKTGNSIVLRGGKETMSSNKALVSLIRQIIESNNLPPDVVQFIDDPDRQRVHELLKLHEYVDILIPRGAASLHEFCRQNSTIPVITGGIGICHLFVDESADLDAALGVIQNAKVQRPSVCNALDTVLLHEKVAPALLPRLIAHLAKDGVTFRLHPSASKYLDHAFGDTVQPAGPNDFDTEWLSLVLGIKVVQDLEEAIEHIAQHSTGHSDGILTRNDGNAKRFIAEVDSAAVYVNASTRFTDGAQFGLGGEVAVSTQRLHARGPMGLRELTIYKWVVLGENHIRP